LLNTVGLLNTYDFRRIAGSSCSRSHPPRPPKPLAVAKVARNFAYLCDVFHTKPMRRDPASASVVDHPVEMAGPNRAAPMIAILVK